MQLLAPLWLLAALALVVPIVYHLRRNRPPEVIRVGSVADLASGAARANRRTPRDLILLLLRCAILVLVSVAMSRPHIGASREGRRVVVAPAGEWPVVDSLVQSGAVALQPSPSPSPWSAAWSAVTRTAPGDTLLIVAPNDASRWLGPRPVLDRISIAIPVPASDPQMPGPPQHQMSAAFVSTRDSAPRHDAAGIIWWLLLGLAPVERLMARRSPDAG